MSENANSLKKGVAALTTPSFYLFDVRTLLAVFYTENQMVILVVDAVCVNGFTVFAGVSLIFGELTKI